MWNGMPSRLLQGEPRNDDRHHHCRQRDAGQIGAQVGMHTDLRNGAAGHRLPVQQIHPLYVLRSSFGPWLQTTPTMQPPDDPTA